MERILASKRTSPRILEAIERLPEGEGLSEVLRLGMPASRVTPRLHGSSGGPARPGDRRERCRDRRIDERGTGQAVKREREHRSEAREDERALRAVPLGPPGREKQREERREKGRGKGRTDGAPGHEDRERVAGRLLDRSG